MAKPVIPKRAPTIEEMLTAPSASIFEVRLGQATYIRQAANELFDEEKYEDAIKLYERALFHCNFEKTEMKFEFNNEYKNNIQETINPIYLNLSRCCIKLKRFRDAIKYSKNVLEQENIPLSPSSSSNNLTNEISNSIPTAPNNALHIAQNKARYLIGKALISLEEYEEAIKYLSDTGEKAIPPDKGHLALLKEAKEGIIRNKKQEKETWRGRLKSEESVTSSKGITSSTTQQIKRFFSSRQFIPIVFITLMGIVIAFLYNRMKID